MISMKKKTKIFNIKQESVLKIKPQGYDNQPLNNLALEVIEPWGIELGEVVCWGQH